MPASRDEFAYIQGEYQRSGEKRIMALSRAPDVLPAPSELPKVDIDDRQVLSTFDTRPISGFDFNMSGSGSTQPNVPLANELFTPEVSPAGLAPNALEITWPLPVGYVAVIRRVELTVIPPHNPSGLSSMVISFQRTDSAIPQNDNIQLFGPTSDYAWDTHQVFGYWETPRIVVTTNDHVAHSVGARILGTLLPAKNASPLREVGSLPLAVRKEKTDKT